MLMVLQDVVFSLGLTLGVGSSTFALIFFISGLRDGVIDQSERRFLHIVFTVLRIGMALIFVGLVLALFGTHAFSLVPWVLLLIITVNAVLMHKKMMPMRFGPVIAGGSWYALFFVTTTPLGSLPGPVLTVLYGAFLTLFFVFFSFMRRHYAPPAHGKSTPGSPNTYGIETLTEEHELLRYATDASSFRIMPKAVYYPKNTEEVAHLVRCTEEARAEHPDLSLTVRAGGTCMSGGPLSHDAIVDMTKYMTQVTIDPKKKTATVYAGAYFRDIEDAARVHGLMFAPYPSSRRICGIGGMLGNNASGEKSLRNGATSDNVLELEVVCSGGVVERVYPKNVHDVTGEREKVLCELARTHGDHMRSASGEVPKSASGYSIHKVIRGETFNPIPLFVGAQGTLGIITQATLRLVPIPKYTELLFINAHSLQDLPLMIETIFAHNPEGLETFDIHTFEKAREYLKESAERVEPYIEKKAHLFILAQFSERTKKATETQREACRHALEEKGFRAVHITSSADSDAIWDVRRHSFLLMRDHNPAGFKAVPCIEDVIVPRHELGVFIHELQSILKKRKISYGFHGHIGDGSLRIIPVFDFRKSTVQDEIIALMNDVFALVKRLKGNMSADHSDGIIRSPFLREFYGDALYEVFEKIKMLYDPVGVFNPGKKIGGTILHMTTSLDRSL